MRSAVILFLAELLSTFVLSGQSDIQSVKILDSFSSKALKAPSVSMKFRMITEDLTEGRSDTAGGRIIISGDRYHLDMSDNKIWFDGETVWNLLTEEKELTVTRADRKDHSFQSRPSEIFSMYKTGYKSRLIEEKQNLFIIDLYPEDIKSDLVRVRLSIDRPDLKLQKLEYKRRDGIVITLEIYDYDLTQKPRPDIFRFRPGEYKGIEINDMR